MKIKYLYILFIVGFIYFSFSQSLPLSLPKLKSGWTRIYIEELGSFDLPSTMEIQAGKYKSYSKNYKRRLIGDIPRLVAQQKGLNNQQKGLNKMSEKGFEKYARIIIENQKGNPGDFGRIQFDISKVSKKEIDELNTSFKRYIQQGLSQINQRVTKWYSVRLEKINGMSCIHLRYKRQLNDNPEVMVNTYIFQNYDRLYKFTYSYRISEGSYWKEDLETALASFRVTNIK